ncbi:MAG: pitrilysin family protein [Verrucomicrobia bacterium]|nr:pitrilysin family protein [Verrucomicrobiota bacterium]
MHVQKSVTKNGIRVVSAAMPQVQSVAFGIWVGVGARHETDAVSGISHFTEHLLFKGTKSRTAREISSAIEGRGGYLNAFTGEENTCYYARLGFDQLASGLDVLADMYRNSNFAQEEIEKERGVIIEEIMMYRDQPRHMVQESLQNLLWPGHALGRPIIGTPETLAGMKRATFKRFVADRYVPANTVVAFAGHIDHAACVAEVERTLGHMAKGRKPAAYTRVSGKMVPRRADFQSKEIEQTHLALGVRLFGARDERRHTLKLLSVVLGENMSSRLFQIVREQHGLAYSIHSHAQLFQDTGALAIGAGLDRKRKVRALELIVRELRRLREKAIGAGELRRAKDYVVGQLRLALESTSQQMMWVGENVLTRGRVIPPEETIAKLERVTSADIQKLAQTVLRPRNLSLAIISPDLSATEESRMKSALAGI